MKVFIACSTSFYKNIESVKEELEKNGHITYMPNCYGEDDVDDDKEMTHSEYVEFFRKMFHQSRDRVNEVDAILVLNYAKEKNGKVLDNYIGASTFLEMYEAFMNNKKIFMMNGYPENMLIDEIKGFDPIIINGDLSKVK